MTDITKDNNTLAQLAHVGWGGFLTLAIALLAQRFTPSISPLWAFLPPTVFSFGKELAESLGWAFWEPAQPWLSSAEDFLFWLVGIGGAMAVVGVVLA